MSGLQLGNVWIGVQPALGVEGDPMRLLFERDLTPHPQYAVSGRRFGSEGQGEAQMARLCFHNYAHDSMLA